jgi:hypothetical protein
MYAQLSRQEIDRRDAKAARQKQAHHIGGRPQCVSSNSEKKEDAKRLLRTGWTLCGLVTYYTLFVIELESRR